MNNYLNILEVWNIVEHECEPKYNPITFCLTIKFNIEKGQNDCVINAILNSVSEPITLEHPYW
jgi:hypothetical protein